MHLIAKTDLNATKIQFHASISKKALVMLFFIFSLFIRTFVFSLILTVLGHILPSNTILEHAPDQIMGIELKKALTEYFENRDEAEIAIK